MKIPLCVCGGGGRGGGVVKNSCEKAAASHLDIIMSKLNTEVQYLKLRIIFRCYEAKQPRRMAGTGISLLNVKYNNDAKKKRVIGIWQPVMLASSKIWIHQRFIEDKPAVVLCVFFFFFFLLRWRLLCDFFLFLNLTWMRMYQVNLAELQFICRSIEPFVMINIGKKIGEYECGKSLISVLS